MGPLWGVRECAATLQGGSANAGAAPIFTAVEPQRARLAVAPMRRVSLRDGRRSDKVQIFGICRRAARPIVGPAERHRAIDDHRLGVRNSCRVSIHTGTPALASGSIPLLRPQGVL